MWLLVMHPDCSIVLNFFLRIYLEVQLLQIFGNWSIWTEYISKTVQQSRSRLFWVNLVYNKPVTFVDLIVYAQKRQLTDQGSHHSSTFDGESFDQQSSEVGSSSINNNTATNHYSKLKNIFKNFPTEKKMKTLFLSFIL